MKHFIIYIGVLLIGCACGQRQPELRNGDLLFQVGAESAMSEAIATATESGKPLNFTHVGIAIIGDGADSVLEAVPEGGGQNLPVGGVPATGRPQRGGTPAGRGHAFARHRGSFGLDSAGPRLSGTPLRLCFPGPTTENTTAANWFGRATALRTVCGASRPGR